MINSRYQNDPLIKKNTTLGTSSALPRIRSAQKRGLIPYRSYILKEGERLDQIAGREFGDGRLWWVLAVMSNIGWGLQIPPGTVINIPQNIYDVLGII